MRVVVDRKLCMECGLCAELGPDVFEMRDDGVCWVIDETPPPDRESQVTDSAEVCPIGAIVVER